MLHRLFADGTQTAGLCLPRCLAATWNASLRSALDFRVRLPDGRQRGPAF